MHPPRQCPPRPARSDRRTGPARNARALTALSTIGPLPLYKRVVLRPVASVPRVVERAQRFATLVCTQKTRGLRPALVRFAAAELRQLPRAVQHLAQRHHARRADGRRRHRVAPNAAHAVALRGHANERRAVDGPRQHQTGRGHAEQKAPAGKRACSESVRRPPEQRDATHSTTDSCSEHRSSSVSGCRFLHAA
jgi:hypothetical protein